MKVSEQGVAFMSRLSLWAAGQSRVTEKMAREFVEGYTDEERVAILTGLVLDVTNGLKPPTLKGRPS